MNADTLVLLLLFFEYVLLFLDDNADNFQIAKVQPQDVTSHLLDFLPISTWCCL